jgi:hypothetical protein
MFSRDKLEFWLWGVPCSVLAFFAILYFPNIGQKWDENVVSVPTFLIEIIKIPVLFIGGIIGIIFIISLIVASIPYVFHGIRELPNYFRQEAQTIKQIWSNRGTGKYSLFGGLGFYFQLRMRVIAYVLACTFFASTAYFTYEQYRAYEPTHWVEKVYHQSRIKVFKFKKNVPYTVCLHGSRVEYIYVNGSHFCDTKSEFAGQSHCYAIPNFRPHNTFNVTFPFDANFAILLKTEMVINDIEAKKYEIWENKKEGVEYPYTVFDPRTYTIKEQPQENQKKKKKK